MSAFENVMLPLEFLEYDDQKAANRAREILTLVGLSDKMHHRPTQLSGGQQQRVSIARSLASDPEIILADEPTGALDSVTGREVLDMLHRLWKEQGNWNNESHWRTIMISCSYSCSMQHLSSLSGNNMYNLWNDSFRFHACTYGRFPWQEVPQ